MIPRLGTKIIRGPQLLTSAFLRLANRELTPSDIGNWILWHIARKRLPQVRNRAEDQSDSTILLEVGGTEVWWPAEFPHDDLNLVWAEVFLPFPPNGHSYEHGACRVAAGMWVLDAGACEGFFVSYALRRGAKVLAIEPVRRLAYCLHKTFEAEVRLGTLIVVNTLVGHTVGGGFIQVTGSPVGARASSAIGEPVPAMTIDALLDAAVIPKVDFVKMDIEGSEVSALLGARNTLRAYQPVLSVAVYHNASDERQVKQIVVGSGVDYEMCVKGLVRNRGNLVHQVLHAWPKERESF